MSPDDPGRKKKLEELKHTEEDRKKTEAEKKISEEKKLRIEEDLRTKSKILKRPLIEDIKRPPKEVEVPDSTDYYPPGIDQIITERKGEDVAGGLVHEIHHAKGDIFHIDEAHPGEHVFDVSKGIDFALYDHAHDTGADHGGVDGGHHMTGTGPSTKKTLGFQASSLEDAMKEAVLRHWDSVLKEEAKYSGHTPDIYSQRRWMFEGLSEVLNEKMLNDLHAIEDRTAQRHRGIKELNILNAQGLLDKDEQKELRRLEDEEALRYWLREKFIRRAPLERQKNIPWLQPLGRGAVGVIPYTVLNSWDLLTPSQKRASRWYADNYILRWQNLIVTQFLPKAPSLKWFKERPSRIEKLFDDVKEEEAYYKRFRENFKKAQAVLESQEKELAEYDKITEDYEKKIAKMTADAMKPKSSASKDKPGNPEDT